ADGGECVGGGLGPFDEADRILEVRLQIPPLGRRKALETKEIEVRGVGVSRVAVTNGKGRAGDGSLDTQRPAGAADEGRLAGKELRREIAECRHHLRLDQRDLAEEVALAGLDLVRLRIAVAGWPAFEHVRDIDLVALEPDPGEELVEQLARLADEGLALLVLVEPGRLADEHQVGGWIADAEDDLGPPFREPALGAAGDLGPEGG